MEVVLVARSAPDWKRESKRKSGLLRLQKLEPPAANM